MKKHLLILIAIVLTAAWRAEAVTWSGGNTNWSEPDSDSFDSTYSIGSPVEFTTAGAGGVVVTNAGVSPGSVTISSGSYTFSGGSIKGACTLTKSGSGTLTLSNSGNTYSGATIINQGTLDVSDLGTSPLSSSSGITFAGTSTFIYYFGSTLPAMTINEGVTAQVNNESSGGGTGSIIASLSGGGTFSADNPGGTGENKGLTFNNMSSFTGVLQITLTGAGMYFQMPNLNDTVASNIRFTGAPGNPPTPQRFIYTGSSPLTLNNRAFEVAVNSSGAQVRIVNNGSGVFTINKDLIVTAPNAKTLSLGGANTGNNKFAGAITNGSSAVISLTKADGGTWILSGTNTYTGSTTVIDGKFILSNLWSVVMGNLSITNGKVRLDYDGTRSVAGLLFRGTNQSPGVYNSANSPSYIEGTGNLITGIPTFSLTYSGTNSLGGASSLGGTAPVDWNAYTNGQTVTVMGTGTLYKIKSTFKGWNTQADGRGILYTTGNTYVITNNTKLYPLWSGDGTVIIIR